MTESRDNPFGIRFAGGGHGYGLAMIQTQHINAELDAENKRIAELYKSGIFDIPPCHRIPLENLAMLKVLFKGGRGGVKTTSILCKMIEFSFWEEYANTVFLCAREIQGSIDESVKGDIQKLITGSGLGELFRITNKYVRNLITGVEFRFTGLRVTGGQTAASQVNKVKGKSNISLVFIDEAQDISEASLRVLIPTVGREDFVPVSEEFKEAEALRNLREKGYTDEMIEALQAKGESLQDEDQPIKPNTRMFFSMNPETARDPVIEELEKVQTGEEKLGLPSTVHMEHINIFDLPKRYQDKSLIAQAAADKAAGAHDYRHKWLGAGKSQSKYPAANLKAYDLNFGVADITFSDLSGDGEDRTAQTFGRWFVVEPDDLELLADGYQVGDQLLAIWGVSWEESYRDCAARMAWNIADFEVPRRYIFHEDNFNGDAYADKLGALGVRSFGRKTMANKHTKIIGAFGHVMAGRGLDIDPETGEYEIVGNNKIVVDSANSDPMYLKRLQGYSKDAPHDDEIDATAMLIIEAYNLDPLSW